MPGELNGNTRSAGTGMAALLGLTLALAGCGTSSNPFSTSSLDLFSTSSKATTTGSATPGAAANAAVPTDVACPSVDVRTGASTLMIGGKSGEDGEPSALDLRYQATILRTARECKVNAGIMTMKVGVEGRVITGPAGGPGSIEMPIRIAVVREGGNPKTVISKLARIPAEISAPIDRVAFPHIYPHISFPLPHALADFDAYAV